MRPVSRQRPSERTLRPRAKKLRVYSWQSFRREANIEGNHHGQTREIVAATSKAEAARIARSTVGRLFNLGETGNSSELEAALTDPGVVYWKPLNIHRHEFTADESTRQSPALNTPSL